jgi:hypothetical protein
MPKFMSRTYSMPITPFLDSQFEWETTMGRENDPVFSFTLPPVHRRRIDQGRFKEPFAMREQFFAIKDAEEVLSFFREFGPYKLVTVSTAESMTLSSVLRKRDFYEDALLRPLECGRVYSGDSIREGLEDMYLWQNLPMELTFRQPMQAQVRCKDIEEALRATVFLDRLRALPWQRCMRSDCGKPFEATSKRAKMYCSPACAHLQSVRSYNERQRQPTTKKKTKKIAKKKRR